MLKVSETYILGVDITYDDNAVITVSKHNGSRLELVNTIFGNDAKALHEKITNSKLKGEL